MQYYIIIKNAAIIISPVQCTCACVHVRGQNIKNDIVHICLYATLYIVVIHAVDVSLLAPLISSDVKETQYYAGSQTIVIRLTEHFSNVSCGPVSTNDNYYELGCANCY